MALLTEKFLNLQAMKYLQKYGFMKIPFKDKIQSFSGEAREGRLY